MKKCLVFIFSFFFFSCDNEILIDENFVVEAFLFQGEVVDDIKIKDTKRVSHSKNPYYSFQMHLTETFLLWFFLLLLG